MMIQGTGEPLDRGCPTTQGPPHDPGLSFRSVAELFRIINFERIDYEYKVCEPPARVCARTRAIRTIRTALRAALCD